MLSGSTAALGEAEAAAGTVAVAEVSAGMMNLKASTMADCMSHSDPCCGAATVELASPDPERRMQLLDVHADTGG